MKKFLYVFLFFLALAELTPAQDGIDVWTLTTSAVGRVYAMVIDPSDQDVMYAAGLDFGVYKTTDGGLTWNTSNSGLLFIQVQALAISKNNPQYLYAGTAGGNANSGVYRSTDGGANWTKINTGITESSITIQALLVHPDNPEIAWCASFDGVSDAVNGLYKTTNGGTSWAPATTGLGSIKNFLSFAMKTDDPNTIFVGSSFTVATSQGPSVIYKSTDGGSTWFNSSSGLPSDPAEINPVRAISTSTENPNVIIAGLFMNTLNGGLYVSTDAGNSWVKKYNGAPADIGYLIRATAIRPGSETEFYVGIDNSTLAVSKGVWRTTDGGNNWTTFNGGAMLESYTIRALAFNTTGNHTLFAGCASPIGSGAGVYENTYSIIPVELVSFTANITGTNVSLNWTTATETNNQGFDVQRLNVSSGEWTSIGFVPGYGTTTETHQYTFTDKGLNQGKYQYRLKQLDYDGSYTFSQIVEVEVTIINTFSLFQNYPNPFNPTTLISYSLASDEQVSLKIFDVLGREIARLVDERQAAGTYNVQFNASNLNSGIYYYTVTAGSFSETKKMVLMK